jgi:hypothetical protein
MKGFGGFGSHPGRKVLRPKRRKETQMAAETSGSADTLALVNVASQAQAAKVREILERMDVITKLDPERIRNIADLLRASRADGGCGIGCW